MILGPIAAGMGLLCFRAEAFRQWSVGLLTLGIAAASLALVTMVPVSGLKLMPGNLHGVNLAFLASELAIALFLLYVGFRARRPLIVLLVAVQSALMCWFEFRHGAHLQPAYNLVVDKFSLIMALINAFVGGGICLYALGYMREYHGKAHADVPDRRRMFFALMMIFLGAMFGIVFANNMLWLFLFWEVTTVCSFLLIGYTQTEEARRNALRALTMNLVGGVAFAVAIVWAWHSAQTIEIDRLVASNKSLALMPAALLCFAGITKSAQMPFSSWLLGAMVAPTPVSALLHSSTMVKAGVFLVLRMAPVIQSTAAGLAVAMVGAITFLIASLAAITTSDAKKVLAYSTVANLGLIVMCGGIGTHEAVWAGILLIIFHAVSKCLLFLCVGVVEHKTHSRNIEDMSGLVIDLPIIAVMMLIGMAGMFVAPFGMLISKWAVLKAVLDAYPALSVFIAFGSAATLFFWVKWMGKLIEVVRARKVLDQHLELGERTALYGLSLATFLACVLFPLISIYAIEPYVKNIYGQSGGIGQGNIIIMLTMMVMILLFPLSFINYGRGVRVTDAYLGGANLQSSVRFSGSANQPQDVTMGNYYLREFFSEAGLTKWGVVSCWVLLAGLLATAGFFAPAPGATAQGTPEHFEQPAAKPFVSAVKSL